jgi:hypothetical protein
MNHPSRISPTDEPPEEQRIRRICELLSKALVLDAASRIVSPAVIAAEATPRTTSPEQTIAESSSDLTRIESYLALIGEASPAMIRETLGLPRMRIYRAAQRLLGTGKIVISGQTRTVTYRLSSGQAARCNVN